jgi:chemotaxis protein methyltransferase CheR
MHHTNTSDLEISLLLEAIFRKYGYDFREYSQAHIRRRITNRMNISGIKICSKQSMVLNDDLFVSEQDLSDHSNRNV